MHKYVRWFSYEKNTETRFWMNVRSSRDGCWEYKYWCSKGYHPFRVSPLVSVMAHRYSYELHYGKIPDGMCICHACDNPKCIRPDHLFLGTLQDNIRDKVTKRRHRFGSAIPNATLHEDDIQVIFRMYKNGITPQRIAVKLCASVSQIYGVLNRKTFKHVEIPDDLKIASVSGRSKPTRRLTEHDAYKIHKMKSKGTASKDIAAHLGISPTHVFDILRGKYWKSIYAEMKAKQK